MKINTKASFIKVSLLLSAFILSFQLSSFGQNCLTNSLTISTGFDNNTAISPTATDPHWNILSTSSSGSTNFYAGMAPASATIVAPLSTTTNPIVQIWGTMTGIPWISLNANEATLNAAAIDDRHFVEYTRSFKLCDDGNVTIDLQILNDNYIHSITLEEVATQQILGWNGPSFQTAGQQGSNYNTPFITSSTHSLLAGEYIIHITIANYEVDNPLGSGNWMNNPTGLSVSGSVNSSNLIIVNDQLSGCDNYDCDDVSGCSDECYWRVEGNNILNGNNTFGTLSQHSVDIITGSHDRGIFTPGGANATDKAAGRLGWNTLSPTARLHVNCEFGNDPDDTDPQFQHSDIRFENLETGTGEILAIDPSGYVYNTEVDITSLGGNNWKLVGNTVSSTDYIGTNNNENLRFNAWGTERMIIESQGVTASGDDDGYVGINTTDATARLHVNCDLGNDPHHPNPQLQYSDVRFENLEHGEGNILAIDPDGYVYQTSYPADIVGGSEDMLQKLEEEEEKNKQLQQQVTSLEARLVALERDHSNTINATTSSNKLYQNTPNPFNNETEIKYEINVMQQSAYIMIYDLNGREMAKYPIDKGTGSVMVNSSKLMPGMYLYSLVIDGRAEDTKRMVFSD